MKKYIIVSIFFINRMVFSQIAIGKLYPHPHAQLDVTSTQKGILIPRVTIENLNLPAPFDDSIDDVPESLLVYHGGTTGIPAGYYYWYKEHWNKITTQTDLDKKIMNTTNELLVGSSENTMISVVNGVEACTDIIHSVVLAVAEGDAQGYPFSVAVNGVPAASTISIPEPWNVAGGSIKASLNHQNIYQQGNVGIGTSGMVPEARLDVRGDALINHVVVGRGKNNIITNTVVGTLGLAANITGGYNTGIGYQAFTSNIEGAYNVASGYNALRDNISGGYNVGVGAEALSYNSKGSQNTAVGYKALNNSDIGAHNTAIGNQALETNFSGRENTALGSQSGTSETDLFNTTAIGYGAQTVASNTMQLGNSAVTKVLTSGSYYSSGSFITSDLRFKEAIIPLSLGLDFINKIHPVEYHRKKNTSETKEWGLIAQDLQQIIEKIGYTHAGVIEEDHTQEHYLSINYIQLIAPLIKAIQELSQENHFLRLKNDEIEYKVNKLIHNNALTMYCY